MKLTTAQIKNVLDTLEQLGLYNESDKIYNSFKNDNNYSVESHLNNLVEATRAEGNFRVANKIELAMVREAAPRWLLNLAKELNIDPKNPKAMGELRKTFEGDFGKKGYDLGRPAMPRTPGNNLENSARERFFKRERDIQDGLKPLPGGSGAAESGAAAAAPAKHTPSAPSFTPISKTSPSPSSSSAGIPGEINIKNKNINDIDQTIDNSSRTKIKQTQNIDSRDMSSTYTDNSGIKTPGLLGALGIMGAGMLGAMGLARNNQGQIVDKDTGKVVTMSQLSRLPEFSMMSKRQQAGQMGGEKPREAQQFILDNSSNTRLKNQRDWYNYALQESGGDKNFANNVISLVKASPELSTSLGGSPRAN